MGTANIDYVETNYKMMKSLLDLRNKIGEEAEEFRIEKEKVIEFQRKTRKEGIINITDFPHFRQAMQD